MPQERIQKILSRAGITSRRKAEELITLGEVSINGQVAKLGDKAELGKDAIKVKGKLIQGARPPLYFAFYKPRGVISMFADPEGRPTLADYLRRVTERLFPVGRLDFMSEGLILLTNDGELSEKIQKSEGVARVYHVKVKGHPTDDMLQKLRRPTKLEGRLVHPHSVKLAQKFAAKAQIELVLIGSGAIDVKALFERNGILVDRIIRMSVGQIGLRGMAPGSYRQLEKTQIEAVVNQPELALRMIEENQVKTDKQLARAERREAYEANSREGSAIRPVDGVSPRGPRPGVRGPRSASGPTPRPRGASGASKIQPRANARAGAAPGSNYGRWHDVDEKVKKPARTSSPDSRFNRDASRPARAPAKFAQRAPGGERRPRRSLVKPKSSR